MNAVVGSHEMMQQNKNNSLQDTPVPKCKFVLARTFGIMFLIETWRTLVLFKHIKIFLKITAF